MYVCIYIYIWSPPSPHDRPRPSNHRSHRRVRAFSGVSSLSPPNVSVKNHPTTETKKPKNQSSTENAGAVLFFWFFGSLVFCFFWFFGSLVFVFLFFWFCWLFGFIVERVIFQKTPKTKEPKNQRTKKPKNQRTKKPKNQRTKKPKYQRAKNEKTKKPKLFQHSPWSFGFLVFWFRSSGGSSRTRSKGSNSIPWKKQIDTYTNTKLTLIPR